MVFELAHLDQITVITNDYGRASVPRIETIRQNPLVSMSIQQSHASYLRVYLVYSTSKLHTTQSLVI